MSDTSTITIPAEILERYGDNDTALNLFRTAVVRRRRYLANRTSITFNAYDITVKDLQFRYPPLVANWWQDMVGKVVSE
jgi:hypothetical protein